jgi:hypothetical protein
MLWPWRPHSVMFWASVSLSDKQRRAMARFVSVRDVAARGVMPNVYSGTQSHQGGRSMTPVAREGQEVCLCILGPQYRTPGAPTCFVC